MSAEVATPNTEARMLRLERDGWRDWVVGYSRGRRGVLDRSSRAVLSRADRFRQWLVGGG